MELERLDGIALGKLVNSGELSPVESIEYFANRVEAKNTEINAFTYTKVEEAIEVAKYQESRILNGEYVGPFAGVPIAFKDFLPSKKGWTNSHGGVKHLIATDEYDSEFCKAAESLGAIGIGKTNAPAFGFSGSCSNSLYGNTNNPFDVSRTSGGSSGGTAAAVASGMIAFGEGGDAGGSIRIPAGWCNLFGFKPSLGTVPSYCRPDGWAATHPYCFNGVLSKSVRDSALMLSTMAQYNPRDPISLPINSNKDFLNLMNSPISGMRIAFTPDFDLYPKIDDEVFTMVESAVTKLTDADVTVDYVSFKWGFTLDEIMEC
jgi:amidase/aspartyl-tRNA(Asn)/glutamyl-tRNA(Gln) amidotransferase subunit A